MKWAKSNGGPLMLTEARLLQKWNGIQTIDGSFVAGNPPEIILTDYDRACALCSERVWLSKLSIEHGEGVILCAPPLRATTKKKRTGFYIVMIDDPSDNLANRIEFSALVWEACSWTVNVKTGTLVLFDSATPGNLITNDESVLHIKITPGTYAIRTAYLSEIFATVHDFNLIGYSRRRTPRFVLPFQGDARWRRSYPGLRASRLTRGWYVAAFQAESKQSAV